MMSVHQQQQTTHYKKQKERANTITSVATCCIKAIFSTRNSDEQETKQGILDWIFSRHLSHIQCSMVPTRTPNYSVELILFIMKIHIREHGNRKIASLHITTLFVLGFIRIPPKKADINSILFYTHIRQECRDLILPRSKLNH